MSEDRNSVIKSIVALLSSTKATRLADINSDYYSVVGERIPFKKFGFNSLEDFFHSVPEFVITKKHNDYYVETRGASKSAHINELVCEQKSNSSRRSKFSSRPKLKGQQRATSSRSTNYYPPVKKVSPSVVKPQPAPKVSPPTKRPPVPSTAQPFKSYEQTVKPPPVQAEMRLQPSMRQPPAPAVAALPPPPVQATPLISPTPKPPPPVVKKEIAAPKIAPKNLSPPNSQPLQSPTTPSPPKSSKHYIAPHLDKSSHPKTKPKATAVVSVSKEELQSFGPASPVVRLIDLLKKRRSRPPEFDILIQKNWTQNKLKPFLCTVVIHWVNDPDQSKLEPVSCFRFTTYPKEFFDRVAGLNAVSEIALEDLLSRSELLPQTSFPAVVLSRITEIVADNQHGVWVHSLKSLYEKAYSESLPVNWFDLVNESRRFIVENLVQNYWVIKPAVLQAKSENSPRSPPLTPSLIPPIVVPDSDTWDVHVVSLSPFDSAIVRIIGKDYSDALTDLSEQMDVYYNAAPYEYIPSCITLDRFYACRDETGESDWSRVQVTHIDGTTAVVRYIDYGDWSTVDVDALRELPPEFASLPGQAVKVYLDGLEGCDFAGFDEHLEACENVSKIVVGLSCVATLKSRDPLRVVLHDTSSSEKDKNLNDAILIELSSLLRSRPLDSTGLNEVYIANVDSDGSVFLQISSFSQSLLGEKLKKVDEDKFPLIPVTEAREVTSANVYFILRNKYHCRVKVIDVDKNLGTADVELLDLGGTTTVPIDHLLSIPELQTVLRLIPPQATQVALHGIRQAGSSKIAQFFQEMAPCPVAALVKVISMGPLPLVSIFIRIGQKNCLINVNESLRSYEPNQQNSIEEISEKQILDDDLLDKVTNKSVPDQQTILPRIDELFPVYVTDFVNPHCFTVLPANCCPDLNDMTQKMTEYYNSTPPHDIDLPNDHLCAVFDPSYSFWFRAKVMKYVDNQCCSRLLDYGNITIVNPSNVRPLVDRFKVLPPMAFSGSIHGIAPLVKDWDANDCVQFSKQVSNKKYMSTIKKIWKNEQTGTTNLSLVIYDTTTDEDVELADVLVRSGIGRFADN